MSDAYTGRVTDIHRVPPTGTPSASELRDEVLRPILTIHGLALSDRERVQQLIADVDRATLQFNLEPTGAQIDVYVERMQKVLGEARMIMAKYA